MCFLKLLYSEYYTQKGEGGGEETIGASLLRRLVYIRPEETSKCPGPGLGIWLPF